jgi:hypothetical protein
MYSTVGSWNYCNVYRSSIRVAGYEYEVVGDCGGWRARMSPPPRIEPETCRLGDPWPGAAGSIRYYVCSVCHLICHMYGGGDKGGENKGERDGIRKNNIKLRGET